MPCIFAKKVSRASGKCAASAAWRAAAMSCLNCFGSISAASAGVVYFPQMLCVIHLICKSCIVCNSSVAFFCPSAVLSRAIITVPCCSAFQFARVVARSMPVKVSRAIAPVKILVTASMLFALSMLLDIYNIFPLYILPL